MQTDKTPSTVGCRGSSLQEVYEHAAGKSTFSVRPHLLVRVQQATKDPLSRQHVIGSATPQWDGNLGQESVGDAGGLHTRSYQGEGVWVGERPRGHSVFLIDIAARAHSYFGHDRTRSGEAGQTRDR